MMATLTIILILALLSLKIDLTQKKMGKILIFIFLIFFFSFKYKMGGDWYNYQSFYENQISILSVKDLFVTKFYFEKGYVILNFIFYNLGLNYEFFQGIVLATCLGYTLNYIEKKSANCYFSLAILLTTSFLFYLFEPLLRQFIAITIVLYSLKYIEKKSYIKYIFFIFIATQFHRSAYVFFIFYFIRYLHISEKNFFYYLIFIYLILLFLPIIILNLEIFSKYTKYLKMERYTGHIKRGIFLEILKFLILYIRILIIRWSYGISKRKDTILEKMAIVFCILSYFTNVLPLLVRFQGYFLVSYSITFASLGEIRFFKKYKIKIIGRSLMYLLLFTLIFLLIRNIYNTERGQAKYVDYHNYIIELISNKIEEREIEKRKLKEYFDFTQEMEKKAQERIKNERQYQK